MVGWPLAGDRGDSEKVVGGHWQKTEETVNKVVGWSQAEDRGDKDNGGGVTGRRQRRQ